PRRELLAEHRHQHLTRGLSGIAHTGSWGLLNAVQLCEVYARMGTMGSGITELFSLQGKVALVTGASRGLGRSMAGALARAGATVVLAARDQTMLEEAAQEIRAAGGRADVEAFDLTSEQAVTGAVPKIVARHGKLDILLNNAALCVWSGLFE